MILYHMLYLGHACAIFVRLSSSGYLSYMVYSLSQTHIWVQFIFLVDVGWNTATERYTSSLIKCGVNTYRLYLIIKFVYILPLIQCLYIFVIPVKNISSHHINKIRILKNENILHVKLFREFWCWILKYTQMYCFYFQMSKRRREIFMTILKLR